MSLYLQWCILGVFFLKEREGCLEFLIVLFSHKYYHWLKINLWGGNGGISHNKVNCIILGTLTIVNNKKKMGLTPRMLLPLITLLYIYLVLFNDSGFSNRNKCTRKINKSVYQFITRLSFFLNIFYLHLSLIAVLDYLDKLVVQLFSKYYGRLWA